jgi:hypothetical protein
MWPADQIANFLDRLNRSPPPILVSDEKGFSLFVEGRLVECHSWLDVNRVVAFKRDFFTIDCICLQLDIWLRPDPLEISEDISGFREFMDAMAAHLPGFAKDWWSKTAFPPFEECWNVIYQRGQETAVKADQC